jgi:peptidoglycan/xylan/chitin deacetylase (PgdA/CDA1 family)
MTYSNAFYQPSLLELAQEGNCRALTYWMNSLLGPQGISVQVLPASDQLLKVLVNFRKPKQREACLRLRDRLARFICYRLWTLNSGVIRDVKIIARVAGDPKVLWQISVRINSPAAIKLRQAKKTALHQQAMGPFNFRVVRLCFMSSITLAGFLFGYWLFYVEMGRLWTKSKSTEAALTDPADPTSADLAHVNTLRADGSRDNPVTQPESPHLPSPPESVRFVVPDSFRGQLVSQVDLPDDKKVIALTFDDGPSETTQQVLEILKQSNIPATFFMSGMNIKQMPDIARQVVAAGHAIGNRGWSPSLGNSNADPKHEINDTADLIHEVTGAKTALYRPADEQLNNQLVSYAQQRQYAITLWSVDARDMLMAAPLVLDNVLRNVQPGRIILMHDGHSDKPSVTAQVLPQLITALQQQGYRFVTVPDLLAMQTGNPKHTNDQKGANSADSNGSHSNQDTTLPIRRRSVAAATDGKHSAVS